MKNPIKLLLVLILLALLLQIDIQSAVAPRINLEIHSGVVPHHLLAHEIITDFFSIMKTDAPKIMFILSPDHNHQCPSNRVDFITSDSPTIEGIQVSTATIAKMKETLSVSESTSKVLLDNGISDILIFVREFLTDTSIVPLLVSLNLNYETADKLVSVISSLQEKTAVVASVDFSHYLPRKIADLHDLRSKRVLVNFEKEGFANLDVDSPQALYIARSFAFQKGSDSFAIVRQGNSEDYTEVSAQGTTSYLSIVFGRGFKEKLKEEYSSTIVFTGDIMLDRNVNKLMEQFGYDYPFEKIRRVMTGIDFVVGNLEGPIVCDKEPYQYNTLSFSFDKRVAPSLKKVGFTILSLANNHTDNKGQTGLKETRQILSSYDIQPVGDPVDSSSSFVYKAGDVVFTAFNFTYSINEDAFRTVKEIRQLHKECFIVSIVHWGNEYEKTSSSFQKKIAYRLAESGVDLIIGSHPHVVQDIELYTAAERKKDVPIFYSLGNFVFDQYFSAETQQGLMVGFSKSTEEIKLVLIPVDLKDSQPRLMSEQETKAFLKDLAKRSSAILKTQIEQGEITIGIN